MAMSPAFTLFVGVLDVVDPKIVVVAVAEREKALPPRTAEWLGALLGSQNARLYCALL